VGTGGVDYFLASGLGFSTATSFSFLASGAGEDFSGYAGLGA
jgi:hypothetical protein